MGTGLLVGYLVVEENLVASIFSTSRGAPQRASSLGLLDVGIVAMELYEKGDLNVIVDSVHSL